MFQNTKTVETGLSDFHKMTVTVLKAAFKKSVPKIITYRDYKKMCAADFGNELYNVLYSLDIFKISNDHGKTKKYLEQREFPHCQACLYKTKELLY